ncbi:hypothetical protein [Mesorhizobium sp.]|uniref:hypothetical protein n=1 Tax=Mesorhizobium sp. TaxID=1871066 RepID=UPI00257C9C5D|nr:hypothetical protein [Mesorhizobium sp.]
MSEMIDYEKLLRNYMECVRVADGDTFVDFIEANLSGDFTGEEMATLKRMSAGVEAKFK